MIQEIIWSNISVAGMALFTIGTIIVIVCIGVGFMIHVKHKQKKNERTGRHVPGSTNSRGRIAPESELGQKLVSLNFHFNPGKVYKPSAEAQKLSTPFVAPVSPSSAKSAVHLETEIIEPVPVVEPKAVEAKPAPVLPKTFSIPPIVPVTRPPTPEAKDQPPALRRAESQPDSSMDPESLDLSPEEQEAVLKIQEMLGLPTARVVLSVPQIEAILACGRALQKELKPITVKDVVLDAGERPYFEFPADLLDSPPGGGVRLHFPPEFYLDVFRGIITSSPAAQKIEGGRLIITSRRILFAGANRTLAVNYDLITGMDLFMDMLRVNSVGKDRVCIIGVENPPLIALAISYAYRETSG